MRRSIVILALFLLAGPAAPVTIECATVDTRVTAGQASAIGLSSTAIKVRGGNVTADIDVYSTAEAKDAPATCGSITCAGFDATGTVQVWKKCDRHGPWLQMGNTTTVSEATNFSRDLTGDCLVTLKIIDTGAGGNVCFYLGISSANLDPTAKVIQDGEDDKSWAKLTASQ